MSNDIMEKYWVDQMFEHDGKADKPIWERKTKKRYLFDYETDRQGKIKIYSSEKIKQEALAKKKLEEEQRSSQDEESKELVEEQGPVKTKRMNY